MAELALAVIPLGITVTSGLINYLKNFNGHDDDRTRLALQAERFRSTFQSLGVIFKRSQLNPQLSCSVSEASACLRECQNSLNELDTLQQKLFSTAGSATRATPDTRVKDKIKDGYKKLLYPLQKSDIEDLAGALDKLSTTLGLALQMLHLDEEYLTRNLLQQQKVEIEKTAVISLNTSSAIKELHQPISEIGSSIPVLQSSVQAIVPHLDQRFDQMEAQMKSILEMAGATRYQDHTRTNQQFSYHSGEYGNFLAAGESRTEQTTLVTRGNAEPNCSCRLRRVRNRKYFALGPVHLTEEVLSDICHEKDCDFYIPKTGYEKTHTIRFTGLASWFQKGIEVSLSSRVQARGFSLSPSFTYFPVVDDRVSPAFLVMTLVHEASYLGRFDEKKSKIILHNAQRKLQELFRSGRASPNDVTEYGDTILHRLCDIVRSDEVKDEKTIWLILLGLIKFVVATGTSITFRNILGDLALHEAISSTFVPLSIYGQLIAGHDVEDRCRSFRYSSFITGGMLYYYNHNQMVANFKFGPLSLAILRKNLLESDRLLSLYPHMIEEISSEGDTVLHLAMHRLEILEALAKKANPSLWIHLNHDHGTVLHHAIQLSHERCSVGESIEPACCPCTLPLRIILDAGCPIIPRRDFCHGHSFSAKHSTSFCNPSYHCKLLLVQELRCRRRQLRDLARDKLSITEFSTFTHLEEVPDADAIEMDKLLRQKRILGLGPLSAFGDEDLTKEAGYHSRSIYFDLNTPEDADIFFDSGFSMVCADQDYSSSIDEALFDKPQFGKDGIRFVYLDYAIWLFEHEAPLWKWSYRFTSPMPSIYVLADILGMQRYEYPGQDKPKNTAEEHLSKSTSVDNCSCICSPGGCTPFTSRMKWLAQPHEQVENLTLQGFTSRFGSHVEVHGRKLNLSHHVIMVRQATFAALGLRHTCVDRPGCSRFIVFPDSVLFIDPVTELEPDDQEFEMLNIDSEVRNQLEEVVFMFQNFVMHGHQTPISTECDSSDVDYSDFDRLSTLCVDDTYYQRILEFWEDIWGERMQVAQDAIAKGWEDRDGLDDCIQILTCEEAIEESEQSVQDDEAEFYRIIQHIQDI